MNKARLCNHSGGQGAGHSLRFQADREGQAERKLQKQPVVVVPVSSPC